MSSPSLSSPPSPPPPAPAPPPRPPFHPSPSDIFILDQADVDYVSSRLDHFAALYKADVSHRLHSLLSRHESDKQTIAAQSQAISHLQHSIEELQEKVEKAKSTTSSLTVHHSALRSRCVNLLIQSHQHSLLLRCLLSWRFTVSHSAFLSHRSFLHRRRQLQRSHLLAWLEVVRRGREERIDNYWRSEMKRSREEIHREREAEVSALKEELKQLMVTIRMHQAEKGEREERMKQAFVRGVCALNKEAMAVFQPLEEKENPPPPSPPPAAVGEFSSSEMSSIPYTSSGSSIGTGSGRGYLGGGGGGGGGGRGGEGVIEFQPIPMRLSHPYPAVQLPVVTRREDREWERARPAVPKPAAGGLGVKGSGMRSASTKR